MIDVAIVGAGFGGLALACVCADAGLRVTVLERRPRLAPEGVALLLQPNGLDALDRIGVLDRVLAAGQRIETALMCDPDGRVRGVSGYTDLRHPHPYLVAVERPPMIDILAARVGDRVAIRFGCTVTGCGPAGVRFTGPDGEEEMLAARLVVGADGVGSAVRRAIGARSRMRTTGDGYLIGISPLPPADEAVMLYCGDGWCDGVVPLGDRSYFFDHVTGDNRDAVKRRDFEAWRAIYAGRFPQAARIAETLSSFDELALLTARTHVASPRRRPGTVLIGDAAAAVHPHNGQGANRALEDAWQLGRLLAAHGPLAHARIDRWAKVRERASRSQVGWSILIARIFDGPNPAWRVVRAGGYVLAKVPAIRNETTRRQAGLA